MHVVESNYTNVSLILVHKIIHKPSTVATNNYYEHYSNGYLGTSLSCAAYHGHDHIVKLLLNRDVSCNGSYAELKVFRNLIINKGTHFGLGVTSTPGHPTGSHKGCKDVVGLPKN